MMKRLKETLAGQKGTVRCRGRTIQARASPQPQPTENLPNDMVSKTLDLRVAKDH